MLNISTLSRFILSFIIIFSFSVNSNAETDKKSKYSNLTKGIFLVASEQLQNSPMSKTVIYITQHDQAGTSGFIVNRPTNLHINQAFPETHASASTNKMLYFGGPLHTRYLFMLTQTQFTHGLHAIKSNIYFGAGEEVQMRLRSENTRDKIRTYAGFMSWGPEQLTAEIDRGDWILTPASIDQLFKQDTTKLWKDLVKRWGGSWI